MPSQVSAAAAPVWDETLARRVVRAVVREYIGLFKRYPDIGKDDLYQKLLVEAVYPAISGFNPSTGSQSKYVWTIAKRRLFNEHRDRERRGQWDTRYAQARAGDVIDVYDPPTGPTETRVKLTGNEEVEDETIPGEYEEEFQGEIVAGDNGEPPLVDWLHDLYVKAKLLAEGDARLRRGRWLHTGPQSVACGMLMVRLDLSSRGAALLFSTRPDLTRVMGFDFIPSHMFFSRARDVVTEILSKSSGRRSGFGRSAVNSRETVS